MDTKWHSFHQGVLKMWWRMHGLTLQDLRPIPLCALMLGVLGILALSEPWKTYAIYGTGSLVVFLVGSLLFYAPYRFHTETVRVLQLNIEDLKKRLRPLEERDAIQRASPEKFISARLDSLILSHDKWVSADVIIASRLPWPISAKWVHAQLLLGKGTQQRLDMEPNKGDVWNNISGEQGKKDLSVRVHIKGEDIAKSLESTEWVFVEGKFYITLNDGKELILEIPEVFTHISGRRADAIQWPNTAEEL